MITEIPLQPVPNQILQARINGMVYDIAITLMRGALYASVTVDRVPLVHNRAMLSFAPFEGDLMLIDTRGNENPVYTELGERFKLMYWPPNE